MSNNNLPRSRVEQDSTLPTSFFRFPRELRDKIYFLSFRPDCASRNATGLTKCMKLHVHADSSTIASGPVWLILCRQTWSEASHYSSHRHQSHLCLRITNDKTELESEQKPGKLPGKVYSYGKFPKPEHLWQPQSVLPNFTDELYLVRLRKLTLALGDSTPPVVGESIIPGLRTNTLQSELANTARILAKMRSLEQLTILVDPDPALQSALVFHNPFDRRIYTFTDAIAELFEVLLYKRKHEGLQTIQILNSCFRRFTFGIDFIPEILSAAQQAGFDQGDIHDITAARSKATQKHSLFSGRLRSAGPRSTYQVAIHGLFGRVPASVFATITALEPDAYKCLPKKGLDSYSGPPISDSSQARYLVAAFDEDTPTRHECESSRAVEKYATVVSRYFPKRYSATQYDTNMIWLWAVLKEHFKFEREHRPLYFEEDFRYSGHDEEYEIIPECPDCGEIFHNAHEMTMHRLRNCYAPITEDPGADDDDAETCGKGKQAH